MKLPHSIHIALILSLGLALVDLAVAPEEDASESVRLSRFSGVWLDNFIALSWSTTFERGNVGFEIERKTQFDMQWRTVGFVRGKGGKISGGDYRFSENFVPDKVIMYRIRQIAENGRTLVSRPLTLLPDELSESFRVTSNDPNPFRQWSNVDFVLAKPCPISIKLYDVHGSEIMRIAEHAHMQAGHHVIPFSVKDLKPGNYTVQLITPEGIRSNMLMRH